MSDSFDYGRAYEQISQDLKKALADRDALDNKITTMRKTLASIAASCESEGIEIKRSPEAEYLLETSTLTDEVVNVLRNEYPAWLFPTKIKSRLERLGHDLSKYNNPMATIHMILRRLLEANPPRIQQIPSEDGTKMMYRAPREFAMVDIYKEATKALAGDVPGLDPLAGLATPSRPSTAIRDAMNKVMIDAMKKK